MALVKASQSLFPELEEKVTNLVLFEYAEILACAQKQEDGLSFLEGKVSSDFVNIGWLLRNGYVCSYQSL